MHFIVYNNTLYAQCLHLRGGFEPAPLEQAQNKFRLYELELELESVRLARL